MSDKTEKSFYCPENNRGTIDKLINCPTLLSGMSHEMRTHMNAIVAFSLLINGENFTDEEKKEFSHQILSSCEQLIFLFDNFFDSAIIDTGNSKAETKLCNISSLINELMPEIRNILKRNDHEDLVLILEDQVHDHTDFFIDAHRVIRVLRNLFSNAVSNTNKGYIKIGYKLNGNDLTFYVLDSGNGFQKSADLLLTDDLQNALLLHNDTSAAINLAVAKKLVNLMGGRIWIENNGISGTGLFFSVPICKAETILCQLKHVTSSRIAI